MNMTNLKTGFSATWTAFSGEESFFHEKFGFFPSYKNGIFASKFKFAQYIF